MTALCICAAQAIREWKGQGGVRTKSDGSPVTAADEAAEAVIADGLARLGLDIPVISEEQAASERPAAAGENFILVDPLDGTREFIAGRDEYTVNIGLVTGGIPMLGVIAAPALGLLWRGIVGRGAERARLFRPDFFPTDDVGPAADPHPAPSGERACRHHQPLAPRCAHAGLYRRPCRRAAARLRVLDQILPAGRRRSRRLSAAGADARLGHRGRSCHPPRRGRPHGRARRLSPSSTVRRTSSFRHFSPSAIRGPQIKASGLASPPAICGRRRRSPVPDSALNFFSRSPS